MAIPLIAMALGGAALGALANPEDRKKGALLGLGAGLLGPALGAMNIGAGGVLGTSIGAGGSTVGAGTALGATSAATPVMTGTGVMGAGAAGQGTAALAGKAMANPMAIQSVLPGAAIGPGGVAHAGTVGSKLSAMGTAALDAGKKAATATGNYLKEEGPDIAKDLGMQAGVMAMNQPKTPPAPQGRSLALRTSPPPSNNIYDQSLIRTQARMKQREAPRRYI